MVATSPRHLEPADAREREPVQLLDDALVVHELVETDPEVVRVVRATMGVDGGDPADATRQCLREAARAVFDSLDLLKAASTVRAVTLIEKESQRGAAEALGADLIANLGRHGITASLDVSYAGSGSAGEAILSRLLDEGCDLLIMGGYSRSRLREMIFGGASRDILRDTWAPTLLSH